MTRYQVSVTAEVDADSPSAAIDAVVKKAADLRTTTVTVVPDPPPVPSPPPPADAPVAPAAEPS